MQPKPRRTCTIKGCDRKHAARGMCLKCYKRLHYRNLDSQIAHRKEYESRPEVRERSKRYKAAYYKTAKWKACIAHSRHTRRAQMKDTDITSKWLLSLRNTTTVCELCDQSLDHGKSLDHILPLNAGGKHIMSNVRFVHKLCNSYRPKDGSDIPTFQLAA